MLRNMLRAKMGLVCSASAVYGVVAVMSLEREQPTLRYLGKVGY
jgi:hypothetical protein